MEWTHTTGGPRVILYSLVFLLVLGLGPARSAAGDTPRQGGTLRVASTPPRSLDPLWMTPTAETTMIAWHYLEGLYTSGRDGGSIPMLAEGHTVSDDGLVYTIKLRRGVPFHNGKELTAADVLASMLRWGRMDSWGKQLFTRVESVKPLDKYTVQMRLTEKTALVLPLFRSGRIYPKEVLDEAGDGEVKTVIGTGPFKLAEYQPGRSLTLVRFEQYQARPEPPNGLGGGKTAWVDTLIFVFLPDPSAFVAAVEAGEVDVTGAPLEAYDRLKANPDLRLRIVKPAGTPATVLNKKHGVFTNVKLRQALLAALDMDAIMRVVYGHPELYRLDASLRPIESPWWTDVGRELYNQKDQDRARRLLKEAGYQGEPIRYMATPGANEKLARVTKQQLEEVGFNVDLQVMEWATLTRRHNNPELWDAYNVTFPGMPDPSLHWGIRCDTPWGGWNCDPDFERLLHAMASEHQFEKRYRLWQDIQQLFWERVPFIHYGHIFRLRVIRPHVHGPLDTAMPYFWNVWVSH